MGLILRKGNGFFSSSRGSDPLWGISNGYRGDVLPGREGHHLPPSSAKLKNA
jgi:hypothetical protein